MRPKPPQRRRNGGVPDLAAAESIPRPVAALAKSFVQGCVIPAHSHARGQVTYAVRGTINVRASGAVWVLPPSHALWVPPGVVHEIHMPGPVQMCTLYVQEQPSQRIGPQCRVFFVSALLRELIVRATEFSPLYEESGMEGRVMSLILDEVASSPPQPLALRMPTDARLLRLCEVVLRDVSAPLVVARLGASVGLSERSVMRLFVKETGLSFRRWHNQARLLKAFELFDDGQSVTRVAVELGYGSASAFTKMFRRTLGQTPTGLAKH